MTFIDPQAKLFQHLGRLAAIRAGDRPAPVNVEVDLSNRCSLGCEWCHFAYTHTRGPLKGKQAKPAGFVAGGDLMPTALALDMVDQLSGFGVRSVTWTGGGEPTLHPHFDRVVEHAAGKLEQGLYTNGCHITPERASLLKRHLTFAYVSLDAATAVDYRRAKGVDKFHAALGGIRRLVAADGTATVGVGFLVTRDNWLDIPKAAALVDELGADYIQFRPTIRYEQDAPSRLAEPLGWIDDAIDLIRATQGDKVEADIARFEMYRDWDGHGYETCYWSGVQAVVTPNGKVWVCANRREHAAAELGDLTVDSFQDIWARSTVCQVGDQCRVMCRGHIANTTLDQIMRPMEHAAFI